MKIMLSFVAGVLVGLFLAWAGRPVMSSAWQDLAHFAATVMVPAAGGKPAPAAEMRWPVQSRLRMACSQVRLTVHPLPPAASGTQTRPQPPGAAPAGQDTVTDALLPPARPEPAVPQTPAGKTTPHVTEKSPQPKALYDDGLQAYRQGRYGQSRAALARFMKLFPAHALAPNALYWTGECWYAERDYARAVQVFEQVVQRFPAHSKSPDALLKVAYSRLRQGQSAEARQVLDRLEQLYPRSAAAKLGRQARSKLQGVLDPSVLAVAYG